MTDTDKRFAGSIPQIYDRYLVPLIFASYAEDLAQRVADGAPDAILETAAGTGVLTRALAARLPHANIVATDLNQPMLDVAAGRLPTDARVSYRQADAQALAFEDNRFDAVACQFGVMFFPNKPKAFGEAYRVLKPGGRFVFNVWDRIAENEFADVVTEALAALFPNDPPLFMARTPHGHHDALKIEQDLKAAGFSAVEIVPRSDVSRAPTARDVAIAYCQGTPLRSEIEARSPGGLEQATTAAAEAVAQRFGNGPVEGRIAALIITAAR